MSLSSKPQANPGILEVSPYVGGDQTPPGMIRNIVLASNENPRPPSPGVREAIRKGIPLLNQYPKGGAQALREEIAAHYNLDVNKVLHSNGSEEMLHMITRTFASVGDEVLFNANGFPLYKIATLCSGATPVMVPQPDLKINIDDMIAHVSEKTAVVFLDNPGNPLGDYVPFKDIKRLHQALSPTTMLVLDGAYAEYMVDVEDYGSGIELVESHENVIMTRTFSKMYALAGLRLGWSYCPESAMDVFHRIRCPFSVNSLAQRAGIAALKDQAWVDDVRKTTIQLRDWTKQELRNRGVTVLDSWTNFLPVKFPGGTEKVYQFLGERGIITRKLGGGLQDYVRVSIGTESDMKTFVQGVDQALDCV